ncbi:MAG: apolipoprotein N-acyltransferase [Candidatus Nanopelagicales bacterium]
MRPLVAVAVTAVAGVLLAFAFPPFGLWPLAILAIAGFTWACRDRGLVAGAGLGVLFGVVFFGILIRWIVVVGPDAWVALTLYSGAWFALAGAGTAAVTRIRGWPLWVACGWVAQEALRDRIPLGGWPWGRLGFSQSESGWVGMSWWGGVPLLTFLVTLAGAALLWSVVTWRDHRVWSGVVAVLAVCVPVVPIPTLASADGSAVVAVIQGDVPATGLGFATEGQRRAVLDNHVAQTLALADAVRQGAAPQPEAVVWPENSSDVDPFAARDAAAAISTAARAIDAPILVGAVVTNPEDPTTVLNVGVVWDPVTGPGPRYVKQHPVPFGEYVPFRGLLTRFIGRFDLVPRDFVAGTDPGVLPVGPVTVGDVICFEVAYDEIVRGTVLAGAQMLAVQTNNATYTDGGQSEQQVAMAKIRAVEQGRSTAVAATNGISAMFRPDGTQTGMLPERAAGWLIDDLPQSTHLSPAAVLGGWPELMGLAAALVAFAVGLRRGNDSRGSGFRDATTG